MDFNDIILTDEQVEVLLGLIDDHTPENVPDYFWDSERKKVFHWEGNKRIYSNLSTHLNHYLNSEILDF